MGLGGRQDRANTQKEREGYKKGAMNDGEYKKVKHKEKKIALCVGTKKFPPLKMKKLT